MIEYYKMNVNIFFKFTAIIFYCLQISMYSLGKVPFSPRNNNLRQNQSLTSSPLSIYPAEVVFEDVQSNSCYQITLFLRNQAKDTQKLRIISPSSRFFRVKAEQGYIRTLAPGLSVKLLIFFCNQKIGDTKVFEDSIQIISNNYRQIIKLKAFPPKENFIIPTLYNVGRLLIGRQNICRVPISNEGKIGGSVTYDLPSNSMAMQNNYQLNLQAGETGKIQLKVQAKKAGLFEQKLSFSNGKTCTLKGVFIEESVQILSSQGQKLNLIDLGQIFIGQKVEEQFFIMNNTENKIQCIFQTFNRNVEPNEVKVDFQRGNFIIKSQPQDYAKQLQTCYSAVTVHQSHVSAYSQLKNSVIVSKMPSAKDVKLFNAFAVGNSYSDINEQPIIQTLIFRATNSKVSVKIPIKFISVFPQVKISSTVLQYGDIKERTQNVKPIYLQNQGDKDIQVKTQFGDNIEIEGPTLIKAHHRQTFQIKLRVVKSGKISDLVSFKIFDGLSLEVKIFAVCRGSSIRAKKLINLNSTRELRTQKLYETIKSNSPSRSYLNQTSDHAIFASLNKTDVLVDLRNAKIHKCKQMEITNQLSPALRQPELCLSLRADSLGQYPKKQILMRRQRKLIVSKITNKDLIVLSQPLSVSELANIHISDSQMSFGNIFIDTQVKKDIVVTNKNSRNILFEWDICGFDALSGTNCQVSKIQSNSSKYFTIVFKPNTLGATSLPLNYVINRSHTFQLNVTAFITLINLQLSTKNMQFSFIPYDTTFQKTQQLQIFNKGNTQIKCLLKFQQNKHFTVSSQQLLLEPESSCKVNVVYKPTQSEESGQQRIDIDKLAVKVVGGAQNFIKCTGMVADPKITIKQSEFMFANSLVSVPLTGKLNIKNCSKVQTLIKIEAGMELSEYITFQKQFIILNSQQKKQICFTLLCQEQKYFCSFITIHMRGGKSIKLAFEGSFCKPEIEANKNILDFGNVPIMGSNYQQIITLINLYKNQLKFQFSKKFENQDYFLQIRQIVKSKTEEEFTDMQLKIKKKASCLKQQTRDKKQIPVLKVLKLLPNIETYLEIKMIPKKLQKFQINFPMRLCGTSGNIVEPIDVKLVCCGIEPVVYLHPQKIQFETRIIGQGKASFVKSFQIRNPHDFQIDWKIQSTTQGQKMACFYLSEYKGKLSSGSTAHIEAIFKPQQQGHFFDRMDVVLKERKISHISLELQGNAILPSIKFGCNELIMPVVPIGIESRAILTLQNHGYDAITISKWKTAAHFQNVQINVNFIEGRLLSLAKKIMKVEINCIGVSPLSFTTMLQFYDEFGNKYEVPLSCTFDASLMTVYQFLEADPTIPISLQTKQNLVCPQSISHQIYSEKQGQLSAGQLVGCEFIKNWLNYELVLGIKKYPQCLINSEGQLFCRMVNRMSGLQLVRRFEGATSDYYTTAIHQYYNDCIKILKTEGAFLNQIRPQFLLNYKDYRAYLNSRNMIVENQQSYQIISVDAWTALFYQLCKLYILPQITDKMINKLAPSSGATLTSTIYSSQEMLIFKFLNSFVNQEPLYSLGDQIHFFQLLQRSLERCFDLNFTSSLMALKISVVVMTPSLFIMLISKFLHQKLRQFGLSLFLSETDIYTLGSKQLMLFLVSYIGMLYRYSNPISLCFEASIGDKVTKVVEIDNPVNRKIKYSLKLLGSEQFQLQEQQLALTGKGKGEVRVIYQCRQNKQQQAKLLLIPLKQDNCSAAQPISFRFYTSILSKITLKKMQVSAYLYEPTNFPLQVQLPIDITELSEFNVTLNEEESVPSFYCFQPLTRTLRNNKDRLDIKFVSLTQQTKFCRICYRSVTFGQFNFQITAKIDPPQITKQIRLKQLKVNKDQTISILIPRQNQQLTAAIKFLSDHHCKLQLPTSTTKRTIPMNKYQLSIVESSYISIAEQFPEIPKNSLQNRQSIKVDLRCSFGKPFSQYTCTMMFKNDLAKDVRYYRLIASVAMKPKIIPLQLRIKAREVATIKIPIKNAPCELTVDNPIEQFLITNYSVHLKQNNQLIGVFSPEWIMEKEVSLIAQNKETLEQVIYQITLKADEPPFFQSIKIQGSTVFKRKLKIPISLVLPTSLANEELTVESNSKRLQIEGDGKYHNNKKSIMVIVLPSEEEELQSNIKLIRQKTGQYYWASLSITNQRIQKLKPVIMEQRPNNVKFTVLQNFPLGFDYQINFQETAWLKQKIVVQGNQNLIQFQFHSFKQMQVTKKLSAMVGQQQYSIDIICKSQSLPSITVPEIYSCNLGTKLTILNLINSSENKGIYRASIQPMGTFSLDNWKFDMKGRQKKQIKLQFIPDCLQTRYKAVLRFESDSLPTFQYCLSGISQFDSCQKQIECEYYSDRQVLKDIFFTNHFARSEQFIIQSNFVGSPFELLQPAKNMFALESGANRKILIKAKAISRQQIKSGSLTIRLGQKRWTYKLIPLEIKNFTSKKIILNCKCRQIYYQNIQLPEKVIIKGLSSAQQISPYLSFTVEEGSNNIKLKYCPMKPVQKQQYQILIIGQKSKYVLNCIISVSEPDFDDSIVIKTKEINEVGCISFKLTNTKKNTVPFKAYLIRGQPDLSVQVEKDMLEGYGRPGTSIMVKFTSHVYNKRVQDELWIQTAEMLWRFKVKGLLSKKLHIK